MKCVYHPERDAIGTCVGCGKFICSECVVEHDGKNYCKYCMSKLYKELDDKSRTEKDKWEQRAWDSKNSQGNVYMNNSSSASSSASSSSGGRGGHRWRVNWVMFIILLLLTGGLGLLIVPLWLKKEYY